MNTIVKTPSEKFPIYVNFGYSLLSGETIDSVAVTCVNSLTRVDSITEIVLVATLVTPEISVVIYQGVEGDSHSLQVIGTSSYDNSFDKDISIKVQSLSDDQFIKQPGDSFVIEVDFVNRLLSTDTISSTTCAVSKLSDNTDATVTIQRGTFVTGTKVRVALFSGTDLETYRLSIKANTSLGYIYEKLIDMVVKEL